MSLSWHQRKERLASLLNSDSDEDAEGLTLDRLMHGQNVIGKTSKTKEVDALRFKDRDLNVVGTLEYGQFGVIDVVTCHLDNGVYVRKSIEKRFALRTRDQCSPQFERDLLLQALKTDSPWAPHLLCAFQTPTHLNLVMDYAEGGTLWDVLESSPHDGRIPESDLRWWMPQVVSAVHWCHSQGFAHRDIKPHNFVLTPDAHVLLIDFGSAAPLLPPNADGSQLLAKRYCLVPCGTCDYISPEILQAHEEALVAMEMDDADEDRALKNEGYGAETDWWSLAAMVYEMAYGVAPFFAPDIRQTYIRIMNHEKSLKFDQKIDISHKLQHFLRRLLTHAKKRLGRRNVMEITDHPVFEDVDWSNLPLQTAPVALHLPQFTYSEPKASSAPAAQPEKIYNDSGSLSQGFAFSAFFQQSSTASPSLSVLRPSPIANPTSLSLSATNTSASFIGFSWGPALDAFPGVSLIIPNDITDVHSTPRPLLRTPKHVQQTPMPSSRTQTLSVPLTWGPGAFSTPGSLRGYSTPMKPYTLSPHATLPRTSTIRRTAPRRSVSDREAMKQLVDCVGMSARKKVLESGRKSKILGVYSGGMNMTNGKGGSTGTARKELRFDRLAMPIPAPDYSGVSSTRSRPRSRSNSLSRSFSHIIANDDDTQPNLDDTSDIYYYSADIPNNNGLTDTDHGIYSSTETTDSEGGGPPSPSPSPRPGSAMSMMSMTTMLSRRSGTPTISGYFNGPGSALRRMRSGSGSMLGRPSDRSLTTTVTMGTTSSGFLSIPSAGPENVDFRLGQPPAVQAGIHSEPFVRRIEMDTERMREIQGSAHPASVERTASMVGDKTEGRVRVGMTSKTRSRAASASTIEERRLDPWLDELDRRHTCMIREIEQLEEKFEEVSVLISR